MSRVGVLFQPEPPTHPMPLPPLSCRMGGIPSRNAKGERLLLYVGIIDVLQSYR